MKSPQNQTAFDCIVVGSGTAGATVARELSGRGQKVLLLERGKYRPLKETLWTLASMFSEVRVADKMKEARVFAAGGSSAMYLAMADAPPFEAFRAVGIDLRMEYDAALRELPVAVMPDELLSPQTLKLRAAARALGYDWKKNLMLIDQSSCKGSYLYDAKWKALSYVDEATRRGTTLRCEAQVERVLVDEGAAIGVVCRIAGSPFGARRERFFAKKVILSAGSLETPLILRASGLRDAATRGYYVDPSLVLFGRVPGMRGRDSFACTMGTTLYDGTKLQDANLHKLPYRMFMIQYLRLLRLASYAEHLAIMVKAHDVVGGTLSIDGGYHKEIEPAVLDKLRHGEDVARRILMQAGARAIFKTPLMTGGTCGTLQVGADVDARLQTRIRNLHVCDGSLIPEDGRVAPALTLICLARYLAGILLGNHRASEARTERAELALA